MLSRLTNSLRTYTFAVVCAHLVALGWFFPKVLAVLIVPPIMFYLLFLYCELVYEIEIGYRLKLLQKMKEADSDLTRDVIRWELILHEEHSLFNLNTDRIGI